MEGLGEQSLKTLGEGDSPAASEKEILRLTVECLARRGAGLSDEEEWIEIEDLDLGILGGVGVSGRDEGGYRTLDSAVVREAQARLSSRGVDVSTEEIQTLHRR